MNRVSLIPLAGNPHFSMLMHRVQYLKNLFMNLFTWEVKWTQIGMRFHFGWKSHLVFSQLLCSHELGRNETQNGMDFISVILTKMKSQSRMRFSCGHNLPEAKWISTKHYPKWNSCTCPSKYRVVLKCSCNETSCEQNLFSHRFEISNRYEFISLLMWTYSQR